MTIKFGYRKVMMEAGINDNKSGVVKLQKVFSEDKVTPYDVPCYLIFDNIESLDCLITMLQYTKSAMLHDRHDIELQGDME